MRGREGEVPRLSLLLPPDPVPMHPLAKANRKPIQVAEEPPQGKGGRGWVGTKASGEQAAQEEPVLKGTAIPAAGGSRGQPWVGRGCGQGSQALHPPCQVFTRYGKCYTFNSGRDGRPPLKTMKGGTGNGLEIMLDIQQDEYLPVWGETGMSPLRGPSPQFQASASARGLLGSTVGPEAGPGLSSLPPSIAPSPSPMPPD